MNETTTSPQLSRGLVLRVSEDSCEIRADGHHRTVGFARMFPTPRTERVAPGNLVAVATTDDGHEVVVWRWYDAVVLEDGEDGVRLWEPFHGEVVARPRPAYDSPPPGTRAYLSAGLPGGEWWVAGRVAPDASEAAVELDDVVALYTAHDLWRALT
jgi:hypothetical protein